MNPPQFPSSSAVLHNLPNIGNSCYLSSTLVSLFVATDAFDGLLTPSPRAPAPLRHTLSSLVASVRAGRRVQPALIASLLDALTGVWAHNGRQHDAAEFLSQLLDALRAPFLPLMRCLAHDGPRDRDDEALCTERMLWLHIPVNHTSAHLACMLDDYFSPQPIDGLLRSGRRVNATETRSLIPEYAAIRETGETTSAERYLFNVIAIPVAIRRFDMRGKKLRTKVHISVQIDARKYLRKFANDTQLFMTLCAIICHRGHSRNSGHYVAYTRAGSSKWRRWNDLRRGEVELSTVHSDGLPRSSEWRDEIRQDCYLLLYDLGDGSLPGKERQARMQFLADRKLAEQVQWQEDEQGAMTQQILQAVAAGLPFEGAAAACSSGASGAA